MHVHTDKPITDVMFEPSQCQFELFHCAQLMDSGDLLSVFVLLQVITVFWCHGAQCGAAVSVHGLYIWSVVPVQLLLSTTCDISCSTLSSLYLCMCTELFLCTGSSTNWCPCCYSLWSQVWLFLVCSKQRCVSVSHKPEPVTFSI